MLHRTAPVNFAELADGDDYSYSDGETSDDLCLSENTSKKFNFVSPTPSYFFTMEQHLSAIDTTVASRSVESTLTSFDDFDYRIDLISKPLSPRQSFHGESTECVIIDIAHPAQYKLLNSEYLDASPYYLTWTPINSASSTEYPSIVQTNIKMDYQAIKTDLKFVHFVAPVVERMKNLSQIRREIPTGRVIFHYIGFGLPTNKKSRIQVCEGRHLRPYSVGKIFEDIQTPSWFIFDCNSAGSFIPTIMQRCQKLQSSSQKQNPTRNWCDWFCLCATSENESLPKDPKLPRDFLTACLLSPVKLSILCHILKYFRLSFPNPLQYLIEYGKSADLPEILTVITDAIASDYVKPKFFYQMFRHDKLVASLFRHFILAQYLLSEYDVHPVSNPSLPDMTKHQMWQEWDSTIDIWITSNLTPTPSFCKNYFCRLSNGFSAAISSESPIKQSILSSICNIAIAHPENLIKLADFAAKSRENREQLASSILFDKLFKNFVEKSIDSDEFNALCYIILAMILHDKNFVYEMKKDMNLINMAYFIFDPNEKHVTRSFVAAILSSIVPVMKTVQDLCSSKEFLVKLKKSIPTATSQYLIWILILLKRTFDVASADLSLFYNDSVHIQIAECIFHNSHECRAATVAAMSCFMQSDETNSTLNFILLLMASPSLIDVSYLVRYQYLLFTIRFLTTHQKSLSSSVPIIKTTFQSFNAIFEKWVGMSWLKIDGDFVSYAKQIEIQSKSDTAIQDALSLCIFALKFLSHDPHPTIKYIARKAKESFDQILLCENDSTQKSKSISPPFGWHRPLGMMDEASKPKLCKKEADPNQIKLFENDSDVLYNIALRQMVLSGEKILHPSCSTPVRATSSQSTNLGCIDIPTIHLQLRGQTSSLVRDPIKIAYEKQTTGMSVATKNKWIYYLNESFEVLGKVHASEFPITDLRMIGKTTVAACSDGTIKLWNYDSRECCATWRADCNFTDAQNPLLFDVTSTKIVTGRNSVQCFDTVTQKLVNEWSAPSRITAVSLHPGNENICVVGLFNGNMIAIDLRTKETSVNNELLSIGVRDPIVRISPNRNGADFEYAVTTSGKLIEWNATSHNVRIINSHSNNVSEFDMHRSLPLIAIGSKTEAPAILTPQGQVLHKTKNVQPGAVFSFHPILPVITFGTSNCELMAYDILLSADQK
ncbi:hypothetical protein TRFO_05942 [Tritrichomonas foetus]|uniref:Raptor N-terminal CASPase-like domain-containing protein n=1 Tax=Tritrichomonas foetus TaxID=1144522 RepID=A0A1J4K319_9EUKA|nr:hypothetical protein TRFO_05942 [Tritrichomonas foetus]|eukprot:OHT05362.1 hypothetical protein TRFO_05942 [Tritrichomonas foetus]